MRQFRVLIVAFAHWEGLSRLPALLHRAGCGVNILGVPGNFPALSRFAKQLYISPNDVDAVVADLNVHLQQRAGYYDWVVIGDDPLLYALEKRRREPWVQQVFPTVAGDEGIDFITSKATFIQRCKEHDIRVPDFALCADQAQLQAAGQHLGFPLVIKEAQGFAGLAVCVIDNARALTEISPKEEVIAQKFIQGRLVSCTAVYKEGKPIAWFSYYRSRTWGTFGPSSAIEFKVFPELKGILRKLGDLSGFHGLCGLDFIEDAQSGRLVLLEQNFRPTLTMDLGNRVGVDVKDAIQLLLNMDATGDRSTLVQKEIAAGTVPLFPQDVFRAIDDGDTRSLFSWLCNPWRWREMRWNEPWILAQNLRHIFAKLRGRKNHEKRRFV